MALAVLVTLVWLAGRYEISQVQSELERDTADAVSDLRSSFSRDVQTLQALQSERPTIKAWHPEAVRLLRENREWLRIEWRERQLNLKAFADSPWRAPTFERTPRTEVINETIQSCQRARRFNGPAYSSTYYVPQPDGLGMEVMELCLPMTQAGELTGYAVVTYGLQALLVERLGKTFGRRNEVSFTEADGKLLTSNVSISPAPEKGNTP